MKRIIAANWKMYLKKEQIASLVDIIKTAEKKNLEIIICPSFVHLSEVSKQLKTEEVSLGAQDCFWEDHGAFTGEVSAGDLKDEGCEYVIIGHSERRKYFGETDEMINKKLKMSISAGLTPILCVGETKEEKTAGITLNRVEEQLQKDLNGVILGDSKIIIAYEPIWAIGTGDFCSPQIASEVHSFIKEKVKNNLGLDSVSVLYGGSVDDKNVADFLKQPSVGGVLVGGASTKPDIFTALLANSNF